MPESYHIPAETIEKTVEIKKSRFIAQAGYVTSRAMALAQVAAAKKCYPDARHHCWAYLLGNPSSASSAAMSDDGEPSGTAGKPILNVIQHKGVGDVIVVVTRYFGGIKLGAGGLTRAYSKAAEEVMSALQLTSWQAWSSVEVQCDFSQEQMLRHWLSAHEGKIESVGYGQTVELRIEVLEQLLDELKSVCQSNNMQLQITG